MDETMGLPKNVSDFNNYIADSLDFNNVVDKVYDMLNYKPEESFNYPFEYFENRAALKIIATSDSIMRLYSFSLPYFDDHKTLIQYKTSTGLHTDFFTPDWDDGNMVILSTMSPPHFSEDNYEEEEQRLHELVGVYVRDVYTIPNTYGQTIYLIHYIESEQSREATHHIIGITMIDNLPTKIPMFNTGTKRVYDIDTYITYYHSDNWVNGDKIYQYDEKNKTLYIPLIEDDEFQDKYLIYKFDGLEFKYSGIK